MMQYTTQWGMVKPVQAHLLHRLGIRLRCPEPVIYTALSLLSRILVEHPSLISPSSPSWAATLLFLACKVEEQPLRLRDIINAVHADSNPGAAPLSLDARYWKQKESLVAREQLMLRHLAFDTHVTHPFAFLLHYVRCLRRSSAAARLAWSLLLDIVLLRGIFREYYPHEVAVIALFVSLRWLREDDDSLAQVLLEGRIPTDELGQSSRQWVATMSAPHREALTSAVQAAREVPWWELFGCPTDRLTPGVRLVLHHLRPVDATARGSRAGLGAPGSTPPKAQAGLGGHC